MLFSICLFFLVQVSVQSVPHRNVTEINRRLALLGLPPLPPLPKLKGRDDEQVDVESLDEWVQSEVDSLDMWRGDDWDIPVPEIEEDIDELYRELVGITGKDGLYRVLFECINKEQSCFERLWKSPGVVELSSLKKRALVYKAVEEKRHDIVKLLVESDESLWKFVGAYKELLPADKQLGYFEFQVGREENRFWKEMRGFTVDYMRLFERDMPKKEFLKQIKTAYENGVNPNLRLKETSLVEKACFGYEIDRDTFQLLELFLEYGGVLSQGNEFQVLDQFFPELIISTLGKLINYSLSLENVQSALEMHLQYLKLVFVEHDHLFRVVSYESEKRGSVGYLIDFEIEYGQEAGRHDITYSEYSDESMYVDEFEDTKGKESPVLNMLQSYELLYYLFGNGAQITRYRRLHVSILREDMLEVRIEIGM